MADSEGGVTSRPPALKKEDALIQTAIVLAQKTKALQISEANLNVIPPTILRCSFITRLDLSKNELLGLPDDLAKLSELTVLNLSENKINALPQAIGLLSKLKALHLDGNRLLALPAEITHLKELTLLSLSRNLLTVLPADLNEMASLEILQLNANRLSSLPLSVGQIHSLRSLEVRYNTLTSVPWTLADAASLQLLDVGENNLTVLPCELCARRRSLKQLKLDHNPWIEELRVFIEAHQEEEEEQFTRDLLMYLYTIKKEGTKVSKCRVEGPLVSEVVVAGTLAKATLIACDALGNARHEGGEDVVAVLHQRDGGRDVRLSVRDMHNGTYEIATVVSRAGEGDMLEIRLNELQVPGSPFVVRSVATAASIKQTALLHIPEYLSAGQPFSYKLVTRDGFGNEKLRGGEDVIFEVSSDKGLRLSCPVIDHGNGTYSCDVLLTESGEYVLSVRLNGKHIATSPMPLLVLPATVIPTQCTAIGPGLYAAIAGKPTYFLITARDAQSNPTGVTGLPFEVRIKDTYEVPAQVDDNGDGTYTVSYQARTSQPVQISVLLYHQHIRGSPFTAKTVPSLAIPPKQSFWMLPEGVKKGKKGKKGKKKGKKGKKKKK